MDEQERMAQVFAGHRKIIRRTALHVTACYAVLATLTATVFGLNPDVVDDLPFGGVRDIANYGASEVYELEEADGR